MAFTAEAQGADAIGDQGHPAAAGGPEPVIELLILNDPLFRLGGIASAGEGSSIVPACRSCFVLRRES